MATAKEILKKYWGYDDFRKGQEEIIETILQKKDTLAILPTGGGKSICYQIPSLILNGKCIVITPLIALMKDQVLNLLKRNISAYAMHSGLSNYEIDFNLKEFSRSDAIFLFVSPERLTTEKFIGYLTEWNISLLVIDEAHCISQWGYDFRPSYLKIGEIRKIVPNVPVLALTASATEIVKKDIEEKLLFTNSNILTQTIKRTNLALYVKQTENKFNELLKILEKRNDSCIVYCKNRGTTIQIAEQLNQHKIKAIAYHGGMEMKERNKKQDEWINNIYKIVVCTNAFGMGIDKPDVRCVIHYDAPDSLEAYYQEAGRAGRDGIKSYAVLLQRINDWDNLEERIDLAYPSLAYIKNIYYLLGNYLQISFEDGEMEFFDFDFSHFCKTNNLNTIASYNSLKILEQQEFIKLTDGYYIPSRVICIANREQIEDIETYHIQLDKVLKGLLRLYGGILNNYVNIQEYKIAEVAEVDIQTIKPSLFLLQQLGIIQYTPAKDKPQIQYLQERLRDYDLHLDNVQIQFLRNRFKENLNNIKDYCTNTTKCRMVILAEYFGEKENKNCNICDICIAKQNETIKKENFNTIENKIKNILLDNKTINIKTLFTHFKNKEQSDVNTILQFLIETNKIEINSLGELKWI